MTNFQPKRIRAAWSIALAITVLGAPTAYAASSAANASAATPSTLSTQALTSTFQLPGNLPVPKPPTVSAASVVLMDADNGQILYEKNPNARRAPASTTKIMTMLLVMEAVAAHKVSWSDIVPVTPDAYKVATEPGVSDAYLDPREKLTLQQMMKYVAVLSANDATVAIADFIGGDKQSFVQEMNQEAQKLGMTGTHYMNPDGLPNPNHYSTAHDLAILTRYLVEKYPQILQYTSRPTATVQDITTGKTHTWTNTDEMLGKYPGIDGLKTGFTSAAGYCFVGTAEQNGVRLISVVLGSKSNADRFADTQKLFDYGFHQFTEDRVLRQGQAVPDAISVPDGKLTEIQGSAQRDLILDLPSGVNGKIQVKASPVHAPVKTGEQVGEVNYVVGNQVVSTDPLVSPIDDGKANIVTRLWRKAIHAVDQWFSHLLHHL